MKRKTLTPREKEFCRRYIFCGDALEAANLAGYKKTASKQADALLLREDICAEIERLSKLKRETSARLAQAGYHRLAFGSIADAVSLLYMEKADSKELRKMDLFCVSEIKRPKDGSMEIKFFDRLKALEKLGESREDEAGAATIYDAIMGASLALRKSEEQKNEA